MANGSKTNGSKRLQTSESEYVIYTQYIVWYCTLLYAMNKQKWTALNSSPAAEVSYKLTPPTSSDFGSPCWWVLRGTRQSLELPFRSDKRSMREKCGGDPSRDWMALDGLWGVKASWNWIFTCALWATAGMTNFAARTFELKNTMTHPDASWHILTLSSVSPSLPST